MSIEAAIVSLINADDAFEDITIQPMRVAKALGSYLVYELSDANQEGLNTFRGAGNFHRSYFEVGIYADSYDTCADLSLELQRILNGYSGRVGDTKIVPARLESETDIEEATKPGGSKPHKWVRVQTYKILHRSFS